MEYIKYAAMFVLEAVVKLAAIIALPFIVMAYVFVFILRRIILLLMGRY